MTSQIFDNAMSAVFDPVILVYEKHKVIQINVMKLIVILCDFGNFYDCVSNAVMLSQSLQKEFHINHLDFTFKHLLLLWFGINMDLCQSLILTFK